MHLHKPRVFYWPVSFSGTSDIMSLLLTVVQSGSKGFEVGFFPVKTALLLLWPSRVYANIWYNVSVKAGLAEELCTLHLQNLTECTFLTLVGAWYSKQVASPMSSTFVANSPRSSV